MLELSDIQSSQEELENYYAQLRAQHVTPAWIGASAPPAIDRAARLAEGWIASPGLTSEEARVPADLYRERCAAHGKQPGAVVLRRDIYVGES